MHVSPHIMPRVPNMDIEFLCIHFPIDFTPLTHTVGGKVGGHQESALATCCCLRLLMFLKVKVRDENGVLLIHVLGLVLSWLSISPLYPYLPSLLFHSPASELSSALSEYYNCVDLNVGRLAIAESKLDGEIAETINLAAKEEDIVPDDTQATNLPRRILGSHPVLLVPMSLPLLFHF